ncbi:MAG: GNAT family N-acetyltransferase [Verrucomicrobiales bacterium]|nr:GNAT family N-acetyltransferase [Verrucomicrobiales bacterium]
MNAEISEGLSVEEAQSLNQNLESFNHSITQRDESPLRLAARDPKSGDMVGGLNGIAGMDWLYVHVLWVDEEHRKTGIGSELMHEAESLAKDRGCKSSCLTTFSFQALEFYLALGYEVFGELKDYPEGHDLYFLKKVL